MPKLVVEEGSQEGAVYNFRARSAVVAGRGEDADFVIQDSLASRHHFTIERRKDAFYVRDLGSTNGTFLNDTPIESRRLKSGEKIRVGQTVFTFLDDEDEDPLLGQNVGGYLIHARVGKGGMGTVYMASQVSMDRVVALKILSGRLVRRRDFVSRFISEARAAGRLNHPNIVQVHDVGKADNIYYYSMEFMKGGSIQDMLLRTGKISFAEAVTIIIDAARGLKFAESRNMVHRDIKPDNLMLAEDKTVKICDLGLAEVLSKTEQGGEKEIMGSPHYMSPEQAARKSLDHRSDIYSLGATFYRMLAGQTPFSGRTPREIIQKCLAEEPKSLKEFGIPRAVTQIVEKMMNKAPDKRYSGAAALISDLEKLRSMPKPMVIDRKKVAQRRFRSARRRKGVPFLVSAVILTVIGGLIYLLLYLFVLHRGATITIGDAGPAGDSPAVTAARSELPEKVEPAAGRTALSRAEAYRQSHPGEWDRIIAGYREVVSKFPGSEAASAAKRAIEEVEKEKKKNVYLVAAKKGFLDAVKRSNELLPSNRYGETIKVFSAVAGKYPDTSWGKGAKAKADRLSQEAENAYNRVVRRAESHIQNGRHEEAMALYRKVISNYGIAEIVRDARDRMTRVGGRVADHLADKAEDALRRADGLLKARAFGDALAKVRNISLEGLSEELSSRVRRQRREAGRLNILKQKLIAAVNGQALARRTVTVEENLRGTLVEADESSITIKLREGETVKPWEELTTALICNIASGSDLEPEDRLALGILCLREGRPKLALRQIRKVAEDESLRPVCERLIRLAERLIEKEEADNP